MAGLCGVPLSGPGPGGRPHRGSATAVLNGANEEAVGQFLAGQLSFSGIAEQVAYAMAAVPAVQSPSLGDILDADQRRGRPCGDTGPIRTE